MRDPAILFVRPKAIRAEDRAALAKAGVLVIEVDDPRSVKLTRPHAELEGSDLLRCAVETISEIGNSAVQQSFGKRVCDAVRANLKSETKPVS